jgi:hypothetical protein
MQVESQITNLAALAAVTFTVTITAKATSLFFDKVILPKMIVKK